MKEILFRQLNPADYHDYKRVRLDCLKQCPNNFGDTYEEALIKESFKVTGAIQATDQYNFAFGAFTENNKLIGICGFITDMRMKARHRGEIVQLFVDSKYNGKGIGKKLLQLSIDKAFANQQTEQIILSVASANENAIGLYKRFGFAEYGRLEKFFKSGEEYLTQSFFCLMK
jgi:ribosomal protein S18 acetylase RimI-like enzyme